MTTMSGPDWVAAFALRLNVEAPSNDTMTALLALAGSAAHASERTAAPIACYLVGRAGIGIDAAMKIAAAIEAGLDA